ncbi:MAG: PIN domain-containing protein [Terracidiphilus sp.]
MTRYLLDTNIISNITKPVPSKPLIAWMAEQADDDLFIASMVVGEVWFGLLQSPRGKKRSQLESWFTGLEGPRALFRNRILPFDEKASLIWARLMSDGSKAGHRRSPLDMIIAAVAEANDCVVVTDNEKDFAGLNFINPMRLR